MALWTVKKFLNLNKIYFIVRSSPCSIAAVFLNLNIVNKVLFLPMTENFKNYYLISCIFLQVNLFFSLLFIPILNVQVFYISCSLLRKDVQKRFFMNSNFETCKHWLSLNLLHKLFFLWDNKKFQLNLAKEFYYDLYKNSYFF